MPKVVDHEERRNFIAAMAAELIAEQGLEKTTIREIAKRAGATRGFVAHHFSSKEELLENALDWINRRYIERTQRRVANKTGIDVLKARLMSLAPLTREAREEWRIRLRFWSQAPLSADMARIQKQRQTETRYIFQTDIRGAIEVGDIPGTVDIDLAADHIMTLLAGISANAMINPQYYNRQYIEKAVRRLLSDLENGEPSSL